VLDDAEDENHVDAIVFVEGEAISGEAISVGNAHFL